MNVICPYCRRTAVLDGHSVNCPALIAVGSNVYVKEPATHLPNARSITGDVVEVLDGIGYWIDATVVQPVGKTWSFTKVTMFVKWANLGLRLGTPLSQLSGRVGQPGYEEFKRIAATWGYG